MNQLEQIKQIAEDVASEYEMPSIASGVYLDFAVNVAKIYGDIQYSLAYQAGQEAERERILGIVKKENSPYKVADKEFYNDTHRHCGFMQAKDQIRQSINLINSKE